MNTSSIVKGRCHAGKLLAGLAACGLLVSCASFAGPRQVELPLHKLQMGIDRRFPVNNFMLEFFDIRLSRPQLSIQPERDRVALTMDAAVTPPFLGKTWTGNLMFSGRLYVDPVRAAVLIAEPRVERFVIDGINETHQRQLTKLANLLVGNVVSEVPVYSFRMEDLRYAGVQFVPTRIATTPSSVLVTLEPVR